MKRIRKLSGARNASQAAAITKLRADRFGHFLVGTFQMFALFIIGATIVWAAVHAYMDMVEAGRAALDDILLLFIYLEMGAMVGIYFKTDRLPVLFLLYIAITAMTRFLVIDIKILPEEKLLIITGAILMLTVAVLILQIAASKFDVKEIPRKGAP
jgi:phosphate starvation-inducible membrane PsiE